MSFDCIYSITLTNESIPTGVRTSTLSSSHPISLCCRKAVLFVLKSFFFLSLFDLSPQWRWLYYLGW